MGLRKTLIILFVLAAIAGSLGVVSAGDVDILGEKFTIPEGYSEESSGNLQFANGTVAGEGSEFMLPELSNSHNHDVRVSKGSISKDNASYMTFKKGNDRIVIYVYKFGDDGTFSVLPHRGDGNSIKIHKFGYYNYDDRSYICKDDSETGIIKIFAEEDVINDIMGLDN